MEALRRRPLCGRPSSGGKFARQVSDPTTSSTAEEFATGRVQPDASHAQDEVGRPARSSRKPATLGAEEVRQTFQLSPTASSSRAPSKSGSERASMLPAVSGASIEEIPLTPSQLKRQLSFVSYTIDDVDRVIQAEEEGMDWFRHLWHVVLVQPPSCRILAHRSLPNWVAIFNRWQASAKNNDGVPLEFMGSFELQDLLSSPATRVQEIVRLFDPKGHAKLHLMKTQHEHSKVRVAVKPLIAACVMMSQTLTNRQKLRFLFGMFDLTDKGGLSEDEYAVMMQTLFRGLAAAFGMALAKELLPTASKLQEVAKKVFARIRRRAPSSAGELPEFLPNSLLDDWHLGKTFDPFALPFAFFVERFSIDHDAVDPDMFNEEAKMFKLSHSKPVDTPLEAIIVSTDSNYLSRFEVCMARQIYEYCHATGCFTLSHDELEQGIKKSIDVELWCGRLSRAMEEIDSLRGTGGRCDLNGFLKRLCPKATLAHIRMYHSWLEEYDQMQAERARLERAQEVLSVFRAYCAKPVITERIKNELSLDFAKMDRNGNDRISTADLRAAMEVGTRTAKSMMQYFDTDGDGVVDHDEYLVAMCPAEYRMRAGDAYVDDIFGVLISSEVARLEKHVVETERLFAPKKVTEHPRRRPTVVVKTQVPDAVWQTWNKVYDLLDPDKTGLVSRLRLRRSRLLCPDSCDFTFELLADLEEEEHEEDTDDTGFSREQFLAKMLDASGFRLRGS